MPKYISLEKVGRVVKFSYQEDNDAETPIETFYCADNEIIPQYNEQSNKYTFYLKNLKTFESENITDVQTVYFNVTDFEGYISSAAEFDVEYAKLFLNEGGGSPTTPQDLQSVLLTGNIATEQFIELGLEGGNPNKSRMFADGFQFESSDGKVNILPANSTKHNNNYSLPDKEDVADIFAMVSDLPIAGTYAPNGQNLVNIGSVSDVVRRKVGFVAHNYLQGSVAQIVEIYAAFLVTSQGKGLTSFDIVNCFTIAALGGYFGSGLAVEDGIAAPDNRLPVFVEQGADNTLAKISYYETNAGTTRIVTCRFNLYV